MKLSSIHVKSLAINASNISTTTINGQEHYVIRGAVPIVDDIVMNGGLYPAEEINNSYQTMEGKLMPLPHPMVDGKYVSANDPRAINAYHVGAWAQNVSKSGDQVVMDVYINKAVAETKPDGKRLINRLDEMIAGTNTDPIHLSTGLLTNKEKKSGESKEKKYTWIARNMQFDHIAILLDEPGAGTPEEGDLARLTTIINQGFVVSGASAQEAENAIIQLSQGLASGALRGDEFNSVNENGNRLMVALADSMGVTIGQMRQLAADGKLTTEVIVNGLLSQGATIGAEFAKTTATISQSMQIAGNNITKFFGENATVKSGVAVFNEAIITASENIGLLSTVLTGVAAVMGSRFVGALTMSAAAQVQSTFAAQRHASANSQVAQTALVAATSAQRKALADKEAALSALALAQAEYNVARGSAAEMLAMDALIAAKSRATAASITLAQAETAQAAASVRAATAARAASAAIGLARGALALIGGPAGAAMLAAGAIFYFWQKAQQAKEEAIAFADGLDKLNASMTSMSNTQLRGTIADANNSIRAQKEAVADLQSEVDSLRDRYQNFTPAAQEVAESMGQGADFARQQAEVSDELARKTRDLEAAKDKLSRTEEAASEATRTLTNNMLTAMGVHDQLIEKSWSLEQVQGAVAKAFGDTADEINRANQAGKSFDPKALQISPATKEGDKVIATLEEQNELLKIQDERERAIAKARMQAAKVTDNQNQISAAGRMAAENYDLEKSEEARKKAQQESEQQGKKSASSAESVAQKLANLKQQAELAAGSTQELSREQAMLNAEQSLGKGATQAQIAEARQYAATKWDTANALKAQAAAEKLLPEARENASYKQDVEDLKTALAAKKISQEQFNQTSERLEATHQANLAKIRADQAVSP